MGEQDARLYLAVNMPTESKGRVISEGVQKGRQVHISQGCILDIDKVISINDGNEFVHLPVAEHALIQRYLL